jgi:hypothetical protein
LRSGCGGLRAVSQTVLGWFGHHLDRHYDRSAGCFRWTGTASGIRRAHVPGNVARSLAVALICAANTAVERREASAPESANEWQHSSAWRASATAFALFARRAKRKRCGQTAAPFGAPPSPRFISCMIACGECRDHVVPLKIRPCACDTRGASRRGKETACVIASQRGRAKSRVPMTGSTKQSSAQCKPPLDCFGPSGLAMTMGYLSWGGGESEDVQQWRIDATNK